MYSFHDIIFFAKELSGQSQIKGRTCQTDALCFALFSAAPENIKTNGHANSAMSNIKEKGDGAPSDIFLK